MLRHQKTGGQIAEIFDKYAFFYDTGTGKTVMALDIIINKQLKYGAKFLIICPKTIIKTAWIGDQETFYPDTRLLPLSKNVSMVEYRAINSKWNKKEDKTKKILQINVFK